MSSRMKSNAMVTLRTLPLVLVLLGSIVQAQSNEELKTDPPSAVMIDDSLGHALGLTNEQMKLVQTADENYRKGMKAGDQAALNKRDRDLKAVLLPTQYEQYKEVVKKRRSK